MSPDLLALVQYLSPAFPTGAYAYSHALEQVIADGTVTDADSLQDWIEQLLCHGAAWQDAVLLAQALNGGDLDQLDAMARALAASAERLQETLDQGAALARTVAGITGATHRPLALPLALASAAKPLRLPPETVIGLSLQAFCGNLVTIGTRHVPLGQTEGQRVLARLSPLVSSQAARAASATLDDLGNAALMADLAAMRHETLQPRIFRT